MDRNYLGKDTDYYVLFGIAEDIDSDSYTTYSSLLYLFFNHEGLSILFSDFYSEKIKGVLLGVEVKKHDPNGSKQSLCLAVYDLL